MRHDRFSFDLKLVNDEYWDLELSNNSNVDIYGKVFRPSSIVDLSPCSQYASINVVSSEVELSTIWECEISIFEGDLG